MKKRISLIFLLFVLFLPCVSSAQEAIIVPQYTDVDQQEVFSVEIRIDTEGYFINAFELYVTADPEITVHEISATESVVDLWVADPRFEEETSTFVMIGGMTAGTVMNNGLIARAYVSFPEQGAPAFSLDHTKSAVYLDDGFGTKKSVPLKTVTVSVSAHTYAPDIEVYSPTHPSEREWYPATTIRVAWSQERGQQFSYALGGSYEIALDDVPDKDGPPVDFTEQQDGIHVFAIKQQLGNSAWSDVVYRRFQVDSTPPILSDVELLEDSASFDGETALIFSAVDATSGIASVTVQEDETFFSDVRSPYLLTGNPEKIIVYAEDAAGNSVNYTLTRPKNNRTIPGLVLIFGIVGFALLLLLLLFRRRATLESNEHTE